MADIKFCCPHCNQHITCDELWGGHQLQCPSCQGTLTVPARPAPAPMPAPAPASAPAAGSGSSHTYKPPAANAPRLTKAQAPAAEAGTPPKNIPIRNLTPPKPKKGNKIVMVLKVAGVVTVLAVAGYFGFIWLRKMQDKSNESARREESRHSGESQVGHIANLNSVLDATEPGHIGEVRGVHSSGATTRATGVGSEIPMADGDSQPRGGGAAGTSAGPVIAPVYTLDITQAKIPQSRANGMISGTNFVADSARIDPIGSAQVLRLIQGQAMSPDRQILVYLHLKPGEKIGGQSLSIASDAHGPQVAKSWKSNPKYAPLVKQFSSGYAMKLELGAATNDVVAGKIFLALPDPEQTVVAGDFTASLAVINPNMQAGPMAAPMAAPGPMTPAQKAMNDRYGIRK